MSQRVVYLTDEQWKKIEPLIPKKSVGRKGGRPRTDDRLVFEGILWVLRTGARWKDLPDRCPNSSTGWRRLREWYDGDVLKDMWRAFLSKLDAEGILDWEESFVDATFIPAKKGARPSEKPREARERSTWWWSMARVFLWEAIPTLPRPLRSGSWRRSSQTSKSRKRDPADPKQDPRA